MSQRRLSRNCNDNEQRTQEQFRNVDDLSRIVEEQSDDECPERYGRYDPKELRDAARILSPFLKLTDDVNNPYARLVATELCDTFFNLFYPNTDPQDVKESFKPLLKGQKSIQIWNEFRLYSSGSKSKEWVPLCKEPLVEINVECDPCGPQDNADRGPSDRPQNSENTVRRMSDSNNRDRNAAQNCDINEPPAPARQSPERESYDYSCFSDYDDSFYDDNSPNSRNLSAAQNDHLNEPPVPTRQSPECESPEYSFFSDYAESSLDASASDNIFDDSFQSACDVNPPEAFDNSYQHLCDITPPDAFNDSYRSESDDSASADTYCDHQLSAGSDALPVTLTSKRNVDYDGTDDDNTLQRVSSRRQRAGNDGVYLPSCEPGRSTDRGYMVHNDLENPGLSDYYRVSGNLPSPPRNANGRSALRTVQTSPIEPELRTNALDGNANGGECDDDSDSGESRVSVGRIACNAKIVENAFTAVSLAQQEVERRKTAFGTLTRNYFNNLSNPAETGARSTNRSTRKTAKPICQNPSPNVLMPFDNSEWNDNCFRDKDFVRLLPFFEIVHNQLEHIAKTQKDYGFNMLDDVMSVFYHMHYELGDPRLKNDMLIEHVKLVTKNTWESFFYPGNQKMPAIPEKPDRYFSPSPLRSSTHSSPMHVDSRRASPKSPNQASPVHRQVCPQPPRQEACSPGQSGPSQEQRPRSSTTANRRPRAESRNRARDVPQSTGNPPVVEQRPRPSTAAERQPPAEGCNRTQNVPQQTENPPVATQRNFLRRSKPSGAPKTWVPKVKAVERPKETRTFKAKPLPKFVRDRIESRNENC